MLTFVNSIDIVMGNCDYEEHRYRTIYLFDSKRYIGEINNNRETPAFRSGLLWTRRPG